MRGQVTNVYRNGPFKAGKVREQTTVVVKRQKGTEELEVEIPAWKLDAIPNFVVGATPPGTEPEGWCLYHVKSGRAIFFSFENKDDAGELAAYLEKLPGRWDVKHPKQWLCSAGKALGEKMIVEGKAERLTWPVK